MCFGIKHIWQVTYVYIITHISQIHHNHVLYVHTHLVSGIIRNIYMMIRKHNNHNSYGCAYGQMDITGDTWKVNMQNENKTTWLKLCVLHLNEYRFFNLPSLSKKSVEPTMVPICDLPVFSQIYHSLCLCLALVPWDKITLLLMTWWKAGSGISN